MLDGSADQEEPGPASAVRINEARHRNIERVSIGEQDATRGFRFHIVKLMRHPTLVPLPGALGKGIFPEPRRDPWQ